MRDAKKNCAYRGIKCVWGVKKKKKCFFFSSFISSTIHQKSFLIRLKVQLEHLELRPEIRSVDISQVPISINSVNSKFFKIELHIILNGLFVQLKPNLVLFILLI